MSAEQVIVLYRQKAAGLTANEVASVLNLRFATALEVVQALVVDGLLVRPPGDPYRAGLPVYAAAP